MSTYQAWENTRGKIKSKKGGWRIGSGVESHGFDLINELVGKYSYMQVIVLNATGVMPDKRLADWIEAIHICLSWPDSRIWCNRIGALGGTAGVSPISSTCSGTMAADSRAYGISPIVEGVEFIKSAFENTTENNLSVEAFVEQEVEKIGGKPYLMGYARPVAKGDERITAMERVTAELNFEIGPHLQLAYEIEKILSSQFDETMNINGFGSAFMADQGMSPIDIYRIFSVMVSSGVTACYVDNIDKERGTFSPLRVSDISFDGCSKRNIT